MDLVEALSEESGQLNRGKLDLVMLASVPDPMEAQMFQELLESNGIDSMLQSDFSAGAGPFTASPNAVLILEIRNFISGPQNGLRDIFWTDAGVLEGPRSQSR